MDITYTLGEPLEDRTRRAQTITITLDPSDDPDGHIMGLLVRERLDAFLRCYPRPGDLGSPGDPDDAQILLQRFAFVTGMCSSRLDAMLVAARYQHHLGWGTIATAAELPRSTVRDHILATRDRYADDGIWYDPAGLRRGTPEEARRANDRMDAEARAIEGQS